MKIAICTNFFHPSIGGCETVILKIAQFFSKNHEVFVFTRHLMNRKERKLNNITIIGYDYRNQNNFIHSLKKFDPDLTLIYSDLFDFFHITIEVSKKTCVFLGGANRYFDRVSSRQMFNSQLSKIDSFVCHTKCERDYKLTKQLKIEDRTHVIPIGVDFEEFDTNETTRNDLLPELSEYPWILNVANFFPGKGQDILIDILSRIKIRPIVYIQACSSISFSIGKQLEDIWKHKSKKLKDIHVVFAKDKSRKDIVSFFKNSNVFAFPSLKESYGIVFIESLVSSLPWVSTNIGVAPELSGGKCIAAAKSPKYESIFEERVLSRFAQSIEDSINNVRLGEEGRKQAEKLFKWDDVLKQYECLL